MSAVGTCVQPGSCVCHGAGSMPAMSRNQSADETGSHHGGVANILFLGEEGS